MRKINTILSLLIVVVLLPLIVTILYQSTKLEDLINGTPQSEAAVDEQLIGMVANEIGINKPEECIKAQGVIARTNLYAAKQKGTDPPKALTTEEMQDLWGEDYSANYEKLKTLVAATGNQTLTYEGKYIYAAFHAVSAGNTRNMSELYPDTNMPYLAAKECHEDTTAKKYLSVYFWGEKEFVELCQQAFPDSGVANVDEIVIETRDTSDYVLNVKVGQTNVTGEDFRNALGFASSSFTITKVDTNIRVVVMGLGHGLGLSQNMAEHMAEEGKDYKKILQYFYSEVEITE